MDTKEVVQKSIYILTEYYRNNLRPFFDMIDDDILWFGPADGQFLQGKQAILQTWADEDNHLTFSMGNITARSISIGSAVCEVILSYPVTTHYPSGANITVNQHIHYSWAEKRRTLEDGTAVRQPRVIVIHITNLYRQSDKDIIYPTHLDEIHTPDLNTLFLQASRLEFKGKGGSLYFLYPQSIGWIESKGKGKHSCLHMVDGEQIDLPSDVTTLEAETAPYFIRVHQSYLVNPSYVRKTERFKLTLNDGTVLPIPEKKYTLIRDRLSRAQRRAVAFPTDADSPPTQPR